MNYNDNPHNNNSGGDNHVNRQHGKVNAESIVPENDADKLRHNEIDKINHGGLDNNSAHESNENLDSGDGVEDLKNKILKLEQELAQCKDTYVRSQAEIQNVYKRNQDELKKTRDYAISSFAKDLVQVKDYLEMALKDESGNFEMLKMGVDLTLKQLVQVFDTHKIKEIAPKVLAKLDPHLHQAMNTVKVEGQESNTVVEVMQKGYSLNDRVLRPAMVTVAE